MGNLSLVLKLAGVTCYKCGIMYGLFQTCMQSPSTMLALRMCSGLLLSVLTTYWVVTQCKRIILGACRVFKENKLLILTISVTGIWLWNDTEVARTFLFTRLKWSMPVMVVVVGLLGIVLGFLLTKNVKPPKKENVTLRLGRLEVEKVEVERSEVKKINDLQARLVHLERILTAKPTVNIATNEFQDKKYQERSFQPRRTYPKCPHCTQTTHPTHRCWVLEKNVKCFKCGELNHIAVACQNLKQGGMQFQVEGKIDVEAIDREIQRLQKEKRKHDDVTKIKEEPVMIEDEPMADEDNAFLSRPSQRK